MWEEHLERNEPYLLKWLAHQTDGEYWRNGSLRGRYDRVRCPVFLIGGWRDGYPNPPLRTFAQLRRAEEGAHRPLGPQPGRTRRFPAPGSTGCGELRRWCDHWLKGEANGVTDEPPVTLYVQAYDEPRPDRLETTGLLARGAPGFPLPGATERVLFVGAGGVLSDAAAPPDAAGATPAPGAGTDEADEPCDVFEYRPTVGITGGLWSGGRALRTPDRPAPRRGLLPDLHHRAARMRRWRSSAGPGPCSTCARRRR